MIKELSDTDELLVKFYKDNEIDLPINNPFSKSVVYVENCKVIGFLSYSIMYEKAEINNLYVESDFQHRGIASMLMEYTLNKCKICENITLEVRKNNDIAIKLYERYGFKKVAIREKYYNNEDGILMIRK